MLGDGRGKMVSHPGHYHDQYPSGLFVVKFYLHSVTTKVFVSKKGDILNNSNNNLIS